MIACANCNGSNPDGSAFCGRCGAKLGASAAPKGATVFLRPDTAAGKREHRLVLLRAAGADSTVFHLPEGRTLCGRTGEANLKIEDPFVSPRHAEFIRGDDGVRVVDLSSANGIFLRVRDEAQLQAGDELRIGRQRVRLEASPRIDPQSEGSRVWGTPQPGHRFRLVHLLEGGGTGDALPVRDGEYLLGREAGGMTFPADPSVSSRHAVLAIQGEQTSVRDLQSANGTFIRVRQEAVLQDGDLLLLGTQQVRYEVH
jgi:pSer/pThr/pTyr-binding forkhead associated (FHA) protein